MGKENKKENRTLLVVQWFRICLLVQGMWVRSLVRVYAVPMGKLGWNPSSNLPSSVFLFKYTFREYSGHISYFHGQS